MTRRLIAKLLGLMALSLLLLGSCVGPMVAYVQSPWWLLKEVDLNDTHTFFVARRLKEIDGGLKLQVERYESSSANTLPNDAQYQVPDGRTEYRWPSGDGSATIYANTQGPGTQAVQVFVTGNTPWTSLSEYRVVNNKIQPLRHAQSSPWLLLLIVACLVLIPIVMKFIRQGIAKLMGVPIEGEKASASSAIKE